MHAIDERLGRLIGTILRHDRKVASYKIALLRAINDIALAYPDLHTANRPIAVPLDRLAEQWIAYYWPLAEPAAPILQGYRQGDKNDITFRPELEALRTRWGQEVGGVTGAADGYFLVNEMRVRRRSRLYSADLHTIYRHTVAKIRRAIEQPIRYAGEAGAAYAVFDRPAALRQLGDVVIAVPGTKGNHRCLVIDPALWRTFQQMSLWVEALCVHEWCLVTERFDAAVSRGRVYELLTARPDNRRPLTWERNQIDIVLLEGKTFTCPWTARPIQAGTRYDLDHIVPLSLYPANEMWNLVPADPRFNQQRKRDRLPGEAQLSLARERLATTYAVYDAAADLSTALRDDVADRFTTISGAGVYPEAVAQAVIQLVETLATARNVARF